MLWKPDQIWLLDRPDGSADVLVRCWYSPDGKWRIIEEPEPAAPLIGRARGRYVVDLGMIGPNYEQHGQRLWARAVWRSRTLEEAQRTVERQENPPPGPP